MTILRRLLLVLVVLTASGCGGITLYPIEKQDIVVMKTGTAYTPDRDGYFLSKLYLDEVVKAKVRK